MWLRIQAGLAGCVWGVAGEGVVAARFAAHSLNGYINFFFKTPAQQREEIPHEVGQSSGFTQQSWTSGTERSSSRTKIALVSFVCGKSPFSPSVELMITVHPITCPYCFTSNLSPPDQTSEV